MDDFPVFDTVGVIVALSTLIFSQFLFWSYTGEFVGSFAAAVIASFLVWISYVILKWLVLAFKR